MVWVSWPSLDVLRFVTEGRYVLFGCFIGAVWLQTHFRVHEMFVVVSDVFGVSLQWGTVELVITQSLQGLSSFCMCREVQILPHGWA